MELLFFKPQSTLLQNHIEYFYLLNKGDRSKNVRYYTFPQVNSIVSINRNPRFIFEKGKLSVFRNRRISVLSTLICSYNSPIEINIPGYINEITISFKPLGLNAFLSKDLNTYTANQFAYFNPYNDFNEKMTAITAIKCPEEKILRLEEYLLEKYVGFNHPFLQEVIEDMLNADQHYSIRDIATKYNISRKTLYKHFEIHIGKNPTEMRKMIRFRQAIREHFGLDPKHSFNELSNKMDFFDSSHLNKEFRAITGCTPRVFFNQIYSMNAGAINWLFI
ncbi:helix-turn-helix domain-containing protein [Pedobacter sp. HDW13]|uniref:helix-turn-helix domain-containing protein n=1 Tax=unclassified Pedobacter TaxID=2628915 RepID=UPI000F5A394B|nr:MULTISPECIES: helix-turn-helix domain-containing protein [unclassified Pedobacter]QIL41633.1 helix-turn-helix domain-containing protein [Pedobacter sp. HDW13]RQO64764.1 hypothetical protein DBR40_24965 [Pedobacter sp. KBW01]